MAAILLLRNVEEEQAVGATYCKNIDNLLKESDFVALAVNLTSETTGLVGRRELSIMKPTATLVNVSRGWINPGYKTVPDQLFYPRC